MSFLARENVRASRRFPRSREGERGLGLMSREKEIAAQPLLGQRELDSRD